MARKAKRRRSKRGTTIPLAVAAPILAEFTAGPLPRLMAGNFNGATNSLMMDYTGYNGLTKEFRFSNLKAGTLPLIFGVMVHKIVGGKLGVNRMLANAGIPFVRL